MALFSAIVYKRLDRPPDGLYSALTAAAHVQPESVVEATVRCGARTVYVHALRTSTGFYADEQQTHFAPESSVLLNGYVFRYDKDAPELLDASVLARGFSVSRFDSLAGEYAVVNIAADGTITALVDPDGLQNLFYAETDDVFAVSTRPSLLAAITGHRSLDLHALTWISAIGYRVGTRTAYRGVEAIPQGRALVWSGRATLVDRRNGLCRVHRGGVGGRPRWFEEQLELGIAAAGRAVQLAHRGADQIPLPISGGKDSRVVLALCLAAGLRDRLTLYTNGPPDHPDVVVGSMVADAVGLPHRVLRNAPVSASFLEAPEFMHRVSAFAFQADGLAGAWNNFLTPRTGREVHLSGHMGEVLKAYAKRPFDPTKPLDPIDLVKLQAPFDPMGVVRRKARRALADDLATRLRRLRDRGFTLADLPDLYYYTNRVPNWLGAWRQVRPFRHEMVLPLGVPPLVRMAFAATARERQIEKIHYEIVRQLSPELLGVPFAMQKWHPELGAPHVPSIEMPRGSRTPRHGSWQYSVNRDPAVRAAIVSLINETAGSPFWNLVAADRLSRRVRNGALKMMDLISLLGILSSAIFASGRYEPMKILAPGSPLPLVPYAKADLEQWAR